MVFTWRPYHWCASICEWYIISMCHACAHCCSICTCSTCMFAASVHVGHHQASSRSDTFLQNAWLYVGDWVYCHGLQWVVMHSVACVYGTTLVHYACWHMLISYRRQNTSGKLCSCTTTAAQTVIGMYACTSHNKHLVAIRQSPVPCTSCSTL